MYFKASLLSALNHKKNKLSFTYSLSEAQQVHTPALLVVETTPVVLVRVQSETEFCKNIQQTFIKPFCYPAEILEIRNNTNFVPIFVTFFNQLTPTLQ